MGGENCRLGPVDLSVYEYVRRVYKGSGIALGELTAQARQFESEMNAWIDYIERKGLAEVDFR